VPGTDISFCMILRDGGPALASCLESVAPLVDEMIVVDTGSIDGSVELARSFGARVLTAAWEDDFAAARNHYLRAARCPWILSLDADEFITGTNRAALRSLITRRPPTAFVVAIRNYVAMEDSPWPIPPSRFAGEVQPGIGCTLSRTIRLFPRRSGVSYSYPVHESLLPTLHRQRIRIGSCDLVIHHTGHLRRHGTGGKHALYRRLGLKKLAQYPTDFVGYLEFGLMLLHDGDYEAANRRLSQCLCLNPFCADAYYYASLALFRARRLGEARKRVLHGLRLFPRHPDLVYMRGVIEFETGNVVEALALMAPVLHRATGLIRTELMHSPLKAAGNPGANGPEPFAS
jgi:glycosyltransferase involved in cell wall biosynthesis